MSAPIEDVLGDLGFALIEELTPGELAAIAEEYDKLWICVKGRKRGEETEEPNPGFHFDDPDPEAVELTDRFGLLWATHWFVFHPTEVGIDPPGAVNLKNFSGRDAVAYHQHNPGYFWSKTPGIEGHFNMKAMDICPGNHKNVSYLITGHRAGGGITHQRTVLLDADTPQRLDLSDFKDIHRLKFTVSSATAKELHPNAIGTDNFLCITNVDMEPVF